MYALEDEEPQWWHFAYSALFLVTKENSKNKNEMQATTNLYILDRLRACFLGVLRMLYVYWFFA